MVYKKTVVAVIILLVCVGAFLAVLRRSASLETQVEMPLSREAASTTVADQPLGLAAAPTYPVSDAVESEIPMPVTQKLDAIRDEPDSMERPGMLLDLMFEASMEEVMELLAISEDEMNYSLGFRDSMKVAAFERWYQLDPAAAISAMDASTLSASQKNARMENLISEWSSRSPQEVLAFLDQGALSGVSADLAYGALARGSSLAGDRDAVDYALENMQDPKLRFYALKSAARALRRDHGDQFEDWLSTLPTEDQNVAIAEGAWIMADKEIDQALAGLDLLDERDAAELPVTRLRVAVKWADNDPAAAADWMVTQDVTGEDREILFANVLRVWISKDQGAAVGWADALIENGEIDEAFMNRVAGRM